VKKKSKKVEKVQIWVFLIQKGGKGMHISVLGIEDGYWSYLELCEALFVVFG